MITVSEMRRDNDYRLGDAARQFGSLAEITLDEKTGSPNSVLDEQPRRECVKLDKIKRVGVPAKKKAAGRINRPAAFEMVAWSRYRHEAECSSTATA
jgi:hypothetical protein